MWWRAWTPPAWYTIWRWKHHTPTRTHLQRWKKQWHYIFTHTHTELISSMDWSVTTHRLTGLSTNTSTERYKKLRTAKVFYTWSIETVNKSPCIILPCPSKSIATLTPHDCKCWELQWFRWIWKHAKNCQLLCLCLFNPPPFFPR